MLIVKSDEKIYIPHAISYHYLLGYAIVNKTLLLRSVLSFVFLNVSQTITKYGFANIIWRSALGCSFDGKIGEVDKYVQPYAS